MGAQEATTGAQTGAPLPDLDEIADSVMFKTLQARNEERKRITRARSDMRKYLIYRWTHRGLLCGIALSPGYGFNGYVRLPQALYERTPDYDVLNYSIEVHGGLTYGPDHGRWVGFDTAHAWDHWPWRTVSSHIGTFDFRRRERARLMASSLGMIDGGAYRIDWTIPRLKAEVNSLARQLRALAEGRPQPEDSHG